MLSLCLLYSFVFVFLLIFMVISLKTKYLNISFHYAIITTLKFLKFRDADKKIVKTCVTPTCLLKASLLIS